MSRYTGHSKEAKIPIKVAIFTVSTSRYKRKMKNLEYVDESGLYVEKFLLKMGASVVFRDVIPDNISFIRDMVFKYENDVNVIIFIGGTGITPTDVTIEAIKPLLDKEITSFPTIFTFLSYEDVGTAVLPSRAIAGIRGRTLIICLPGSPGAVKLAMEKIVSLELGHLINMIYGFK